MIEKLKQTQTQTQTNCQERVCPVHAVFPQGQQSFGGAVVIAKNAHFEWL